MITRRFGRLIAAVAAPLLLLGAANARCETPAPPAAEYRLHKAIDLFDHISVASAGDGDAVVLIPGLSSPAAVWDDVAPMLARKHSVILVQVNGFGADGPRGNLRPGILDGVVEDLHAYLQKYKIARPAIIGHSMGGLVALMLAKAHPEDAGRVMVVDALPWYGMLFGAGASVATLEPQAKAMRDGIVGSYGKPADAAAAQAMAARMAVTPAVRAQIVGWMRRADPRVTGQAMYEDMMTDLRPAIAGIAAPITVVVPYSADCPREQGEAVYREAYKNAPHVTFAPIANSGHFAMLDQPRAFNAAVAEFLR